MATLLTEEQTDKVISFLTKNYGFTSGGFRVVGIITREWPTQGPPAQLGQHLILEVEDEVPERWHSEVPGQLTSNNGKSRYYIAIMPVFALEL